MCSKNKGVLDKPTAGIINNECYLSQFNRLYIYMWRVLCKIFQVNLCCIYNRKLYKNLRGIRETSLRASFT